jgi:hypothetical protein
MSKNWVFLPHVAIAAAYWAWAHALIGEPAWIAIALVAHAVAPAWAALLARREAPWPAFWAGPGSLIGIHAASIVIELWRLGHAPPADPWRTLVVLALWTVAVAIYAGYALLAFVVVLRTRR